jgi:AcrR family transcriptional regulator
VPAESRKNDEHTICRKVYDAAMKVVAGSAADGRTARALRTRARLVDALVGLIQDGDPSPNVEQIAARAGVSTRSVYAHFPSVEVLRGAVAERATMMVLGMLSPIRPDAPVRHRIDDLCRQRARVNEGIGPLRRAAALHAISSPALAAQRAYARDASRAQVERVFARELAGFDGPRRRRRVGAIDAAVSGETWDVLREAHGFSVATARATVADMVEALLGTG